MKRDDVLSLILNEMRGIRGDFRELSMEVKQIRQTDIPEIKEKVAVVEEKASNSAKIITGVGGILSVMTAAAIAWFHK